MSADISPGTSAPLDSSGGADPVSGGSATGTPSPSETESRINGLMSSYNKEQNARKEIEKDRDRLQGLLATAVATIETMKVQLAEADKGNTDKVTSAETRATTSEARVAELTGEVERITAENTRLAFLVANPDLAAYADVLPATGNKEAFDRAATAIRTARDAEAARIKDHFTGSPGGGGQTPRTGRGKPSATEIEEYLRTASPAEFEARLQEMITATSA
jgi:hypothetical protein